MQFSEAEANLVPQAIASAAAASHKADDPGPAVGSLPGNHLSKDTALEEQKRARRRGGGETWQGRLLPLMAGMLVALTAFFFVASFVQLYYLQTRIERAPQLDLGPAMTWFDGFEKDLRSGVVKDRTAFDQALQYGRWKTLALLEANALQRRYHQAGVLLISRIWTRYLGFVTGTILALVGAAFILGKLRETTSQFGTESALWKVSMTTASPGLILATLGTILMLTTLATNLEMQVNDGAVYLPQQSALESDAAPRPLVPDGPIKIPSETEPLKKMKR